MLKNFYKFNLQFVYHLTWNTSLTDPNTCSSSNNPILSTYSGETEFTNCGNYYHLKYDCLTLTKDQIHNLHKESFSCYNYQCLENNLPFNPLADHDFSDATGQIIDDPSESVEKLRKLGIKPLIQRMAPKYKTYIEISNHRAITTLKMDLRL